MIWRSAIKTVTKVVTKFVTKVCELLHTQGQQKTLAPTISTFWSFGRLGVKTDVTVLCDVINKTQDFVSR